MILKDKYIEFYSEPDVSIGYWCFKKIFNIRNIDKTVVVPSCAEKDTILHLLNSLNVASLYVNQRILVIIVINQNLEAPEWMFENNQLTLQMLSMQLKEKHVLEEEFLACVGKWKNLNLLLVDRSSHGYQLPSKQGVGLARKIGSDIAYLGWKLKIISSPFALTTDGDAKVPQSYFDIDHIFNLKKVSAFLYDFKHVPTVHMSAQEIKAVKLYDQYLRFYRDGLKFSDSCYSYISIGSAIGFSFEKYSLVRGFSKKLAGEDFYFLNKMRKLGDVIEVDKEPIELLGRLSTRVPFGTGRSIKSIAEKISTKEKFLTYNPVIFLFLKLFNIEVNQYIEHQDYEYFQSAVWKHLEKILSQYKFDQKNKDSNFKTFETILDKLQIKMRLQSIVIKYDSMSQKKYQYMIWFDAFKTLKFIHAFRDYFFSSVPFRTKYNFNQDL